MSEAKKSEYVLNEQDPEVRALMVHNCIKQLADKLISQGKPLEALLKKSLAEELKDPNSQLSKELDNQRFFNAIAVEDIHRMLTMFYLAEQANIRTFKESLDLKYEESKDRAAAFATAGNRQKPVAKTREELNQPNQSDRWEKHYADLLKDLKRQEDEMAIRHSNEQIEFFYNSTDRKLDYMISRLEQLPPSEQTQEALAEMTELKQKNKRNEELAANVEPILRAYRPDIDIEKDSKNIKAKRVLHAQLLHNDGDEQMQDVAKKIANIALLGQGINKLTAEENSKFDNLLKGQVEELKKLKTETREAENKLYQSKAKQENTIHKPASHGNNIKPENEGNPNKRI